MDVDDEEYQQAIDGEFDELVAAVQREADEAATVPRPIHHPPEIFRRRFRMSQRLFIHIATCLAQRFRCFTLRRDARRRVGLSTYQKCTAAIRQLAFARLADMFDDYLQMGETHTLETLRQFCRGIKDIFGSEFLRKPNADECQRLIDMHGTVHHFPGMLGSIDCMRWEWRNCSVAWKGQFTSRFKGRHPTMILEAVADYRLRIWHAYFGVAGSNNDINVLQSSHLFNDECQGEGPQVIFVANGMQYNMAYYLADGIYPRWPVFVKTIRQPVGPKQSYFARKQEGTRKDVERAFGVLQSRWAILRCPVRQWHENDVADIMYACIILHNMIIDDEGFAAEPLGTGRGY